MFKIEKNCIGCGECAEACDLNLIQTGDNYILMDIDNCIHCSKCVEACQNNVFTKTVILKHFMYLFLNKFKR